MAGHDVDASSGTVTCDFLLALTSLGTAGSGSAYVGNDLFVNGAKIAGP